MPNNPISDYYFNVRKKNAAIHEKRVREIYSVIPSIRDIDASMRRVGVTMALSAFESEVDVDVIIEKSKAALKDLRMKRAVMLTDHDYPYDYLDDIFDCDLCEDKGMIDGKPCKCFYENRLRHGTNATTISKKLSDETFDSFDFNLYSDLPLPEGHPLKSSSTPSLRRYMVEVVDILKSFVEGSDYMGVYLYGNTGVGKTFLCSSIGKYALEKMKSVEYYSMNMLQKFLESYKFSNRAPEPEDEAIYSRLFTCDFLILDDLGAEMTTKFTLTELFSIVNERITTGKKTIISSNLDIDDFGESYGERVASRIIGTYMLFLIEGEDLRIKKILG